MSRQKDLLIKIYQTYRMTYVHTHIHNMRKKDSRGLYEWEWLLYMIVKQGTDGARRGHPVSPDIGTVLTLIATRDKPDRRRISKCCVLHVRWWLRVDEQCTRWLFRDSRPRSFAAALLEWSVRQAAIHWILCGGECRRQRSRASIITRSRRLSWKFIREYLKILIYLKIIIEYNEYLIMLNKWIVSKVNIKIIYNIKIKKTKK